MTTLHVLCAGAAQGLVRALQPRFESSTGARLQGRFGAVGAMKEALLAGEPCDLMIVTAAMVAELVTDGALRREGARPLGRVRTGVALRNGTPPLPLATADELKAALLRCDALLIPDMRRSTAGAHVASVLQQLGIADAMAARLREHPNGATAMRELAASRQAMPIGITQISEILYTPGVRLAAALPQAFELATTYTAAIASRAASPESAAAFIGLLTDAEAAELRQGAGFEP